MLDWLPAARRVPHGSALSWSEATDPKGVLHTTETAHRAGYDGWAVAPHAEVLPIPGVGVEVEQFIPFTRASFALRHTRAQDTNRDYAVQFELVGTCDPASPIRGAYQWYTADDAVLLDLYRKVIKPTSDGLGIPVRALPFKPWPASAGFGNGARLTDAQFDVYTGWLGHQHVPQNDHGDPGGFPWARMVALAGGGAPPAGDGARAMVEAVQRAVHVPDDGVWGPGTDGAVDAVRDALDGRWANPTTLAASQRAVGVTADGMWGPKSAAALTWTVQRLQVAFRWADHNLLADGVWGALTATAYLACRRAAPR